MSAVKSPPGRHRERTHTPAEYALHSWYVRSGAAGEMNDSKRWRGGRGALGYDAAKVPWTYNLNATNNRHQRMRTQHERRHADALYLSGEDAPYRPHSRKLWDARYIPRSFLRINGLSIYSVAQPDLELQRMTDDRNVPAAVVDGFTGAMMRPKARLSEGIAKEWNRRPKAPRSSASLASRSFERVRGTSAGRCERSVG